MGAPPEFEIEIDRCLVRGGCTLFAVRTVEAGRIDVKQSAMALQGPFLANWGDDDSPGETRRLSIRLEHVSCFLRGGLIQMDGGDVPRYLLPIDVTARNNIFAASTAAPLISLAGRTSDDDFKRLVRWDGTRNFYDHFVSYLTVGSTDAGAGGSPLSFDDWKRLLGENTEIDANISGIVWKKQGWRSKPFEAVGAADFELANVNQAISGSTDGADAGVDIANLRTLPGPSSPK
jgi:hypothetical protein